MGLLGRRSASEGPAAGVLGSSAEAVLATGEPAAEADSLVGAAGLAGG